jgi:hypothetical protein
MTTKTSSPNKNSANAQPPVPTGPSKETAIADKPGLDQAARRAFSLSLDQGAFSVFFTKLIADRTSTSPQIANELRVWSYGAYAHWGLND